jgi:cell wall-associated NlpC family hydrolase
MVAAAKSDPMTSAISDQLSAMSHPEMVQGPETWFHTPERRATLLAESEKWLGTPFFPNSNTPGPRGGVSCQKLVAAIYRGCGVLAPDVDPPSVPMNHGQFARAGQSMIADWMAARPEFARLDLVGKRSTGLVWSPADCLLPGDLVSWRIQTVDHHLWIILERGEVIHALQGYGVIKSHIGDGTYLSRLLGAWRPILNPKAR